MGFGALAALQVPRSAFHCICLLYTSGICFDIANARRFGYPEQWIRTLGGRILEFHCKDYRMSVDNINGFTNLLDGDVNYPAVVAAIRDIGFDG